MKKTLVATLLLALILSIGFTTETFAQNQREILVYVDGELVVFPDQKPYVDNNGRTLVPVRFPAEKFGAEVEWEQKEKRVDIDHIQKNTNIKLWISSSDYLVNGIRNQMDTEAVLTNGRTMIPIRFVAEALGVKVDWRQTKDKGLVFNFTKGQSEVEMKNTMDKIVGELTGQLTKNFIEPEFKVFYTTNQPAIYDYFKIQLVNKNAYEKEKYTFKTESISHPELNRWLDINLKTGKYDNEFNNVNFYTTDSNNLHQFNSIYALEQLRGQLNIQNNELIKLTNGESITYKVTVSNGETVKDYFINAIFTEKTFR